MGRDSPPPAAPSSYGGGGGGGQYGGISGPAYVPPPFHARRQHPGQLFGGGPLSDDASVCDDLLAFVRNSVRLAIRWWFTKGRLLMWSLLGRTLRQVRRNLTARRVLSFPHLLVAAWFLVLLWGERWVFEGRVDGCDWHSWEDWPAGATPHRVVLVADPQLIDPHSYPGRPWPLSSLTVLVTDNYLRRSYAQVEKVLRPDSVVFLGDLFDGGREWKTNHGDFGEPAYARGHRPASEQKFVKGWNRKYGEDFWLREYGRFGDIFFKPFVAATPYPEEKASDKALSDGRSRGGRGRKLIASLPGNHDLGFGAEVKPAVRERFETYFGDVNRVDVLGNHTFVSVDTVSLSARTSDEAAGGTDLRHIYYPAEIFLKSVKRLKRKAVLRELAWMRGEYPDARFDHRIEETDLDDDEVIERPESNDPGVAAAPANFPTILLTHVPLYRDPGTPCGPLREHWPPSNKGGAAAGKSGAAPFVPDTRNAISISRGYQYQNVLSEEDSVAVVRDVGAVRHVFSGDDHDYCEVVHSAAKNGAREITVKSVSMAMGVPTPGFLMVSLWNPVDISTGRPLPDGSGGGASHSKHGGLGGTNTAKKPGGALVEGGTVQTHLCLLPSQLATYTRYAIAALFSLILLAARAVLVPALRLQSFALDPAAVAAEEAAEAVAGTGGRGRSGSGGGAHSRSGSFTADKVKVDDHDEHGAAIHPTSAASSASRFLSSGSTASQVTAKGRTPLASPMASPGGAAAAASYNNSSNNGGYYHHHHSHHPKRAKSARKSGSKWGWGAAAGSSDWARGPKIEIRDDDFYGGGASARWGPAGYWRGVGSGRAGSAGVAGARTRSLARLVVRELWTTCWRVAWMVALFWAYLAWKG